MNINPVNLDNMFDVISLSTEDDDESGSDGDSNDSELDIDGDSNSSNENSAMETDGSDIENELQQDDEEGGWETTSETEE